MRRAHLAGVGIDADENRFLSTFQLLFAFAMSVSSEAETLLRTERSPQSLQSVPMWQSSFCS